MGHLCSRLLLAWPALCALAGRASAHGGETTGPHDAPVAIALFGCGVVLVGASVGLEELRDVDRRYVDAGVVLGLVVGLAGIAAYWL
jgi:hypothetical protein